MTKTSQTIDCNAISINYLNRKIMNTKRIFAGFLLTATSLSSLAQEFVTPDYNFVSTKTRAEVIDEMKQAQAQKQFEWSEYGFNNYQERYVSTKTRAQVVAELKQAQEDGSHAAQDLEHNYPIAAKTRANNNASYLAGSDVRAN